MSHFLVDLKFPLFLLWVVFSSLSYINSFHCFTISLNRDQYFHINWPKNKEGGAGAQNKIPGNHYHHHLPDDSNAEQFAESKIIIFAEFCSGKRKNLPSEKLTDNAYKQFTNLIFLFLFCKTSKDCCPSQVRFEKKSIRGLFLCFSFPRLFQI